MSLSLIIYQQPRKNNIKTCLIVLLFTVCLQFNIMNGDDLLMTPVKPAAYPFFRKFRAILENFVYRKMPGKPVPDPAF